MPEMRLSVTGTVSTWSEGEGRGFLVRGNTRGFEGPPRFQEALIKKAIESIVLRPKKYLPKVIFEQVVHHVEVEDSGQAVIFEFPTQGDSEVGMFVRLQSWDPKHEHVELNQFINKKVRVTVEVIDDD